MKSDAITEIIEAQLPSQYEPLLLTFYGNDVEKDGNLAVFGDDSGTKLCIDLEDAFVYSIDPKNELPTRLVNTNVNCLAKFLVAHQQYVTEVRRASSEVGQLQSVRRLSERLFKIDARAFDDSENWWPVVLRQMEDGL